MINSLYKSDLRFEDSSHICDFDKEAMKSFLWLVAVIALFSAISAEKDVSGCMEKCPPVNPNPKDVYLVPHRNCSQFCSCVYGKAFVVDCPPDLHYSPADRVCTWKHEANCTTAGQDGVSIELLTVQREYSAELDTGCIGICPGTDLDQLTATLQHQDCDKYCKCVRGRPYVHPCPADFHYTPVLGVCTYPDEAKCKKWTKPNPPPPHGWCPCPDTTEPTKPTVPSTEQTKPTVPSTEPTQPTVPSTEPTEPTDPPTKPTEPTVPSTEPTKPTVPSTEPTQPTVPSTEPIEPTDPPTKPTEPTVPSTEPTKPTVPSTEPTEPTVPSTEPTEPTDPPTKPTGPPPVNANGCIGTCPLKDPVLVKHLPHKDCRKFCKCNRGSPVQFDCRPGLYFNPVLEVCDRPNESGCTGIRD